MDPDHQRITVRDLLRGLFPDLHRSPVHRISRAWASVSKRVWLCRRARLGWSLRVLSKLTQRPSTASTITLAGILLQNWLGVHTVSGIAQSHPPPT